MISLKNTLKAITTLLNDVPHYTLLWTNPNPTSSFAAQTISLDLSKYDAVEVISYMSVWDSDIQDSIMLAVGGLYGWLLGFDNMEGSNIIRHNKRRLKATKSGVVFETATSKYNTTTQNSDGHLVPYKIYGIKFGGGGIRLSVLSSLRRWLYVKLESYLKSDWGEHHHNQECLGRKGKQRMDSRLFGNWRKLCRPLKKRIQRSTCHLLHIVRNARNHTSSKLPNHFEKRSISNWGRRIQRMWARCCNKVVFDEHRIRNICIRRVKTDDRKLSTVCPLNARGVFV